MYKVLHVTVQRFRICKNTVERERKGTCSSSDFRHILRQKFVVCISKCFQLQGASPPDPLTRGFAPGPHWGLRPQTPVIGSRSRARHERQRSGSFFVRTGSLIEGRVAMLRVRERYSQREAEPEPLQRRSLAAPHVPRNLWRF